VTVTFAFGTTAPVVSVTVPTILPVEIVVWAIAMEEKTKADITARAGRINRATDREELKVGITIFPFGSVLA
jgi:hypothetical protein